MALELTLIKGRQNLIDPDAMAKTPQLQLQFNQLITSPPHRGYLRRARRLDTIFFIDVYIQKSSGIKIYSIDI
jgi:hypothetical protein